MPPRTPPPPLDSEPIEEKPDRVRTPKLEKLQDKIAGLYLMVGGAVLTLPESVVGKRPRTIARGLIGHKDDIAKAWVDLCEDDKRVLKYWEKLTAAGAWSEVIGAHLEAAGDDLIPGVIGAMPTGMRPQYAQPQGQPMMVPDIGSMMAMADFMRQQASQQRESNGVDNEEQVRRAVAEAMQQQQQQQPPREQPVRGQVRRPPGVFRAGKGAGIPTPADMIGGVASMDTGDEFPVASSAEAAGL